MRIEYYGLKKDVENERMRKEVEKRLKKMEKWFYSVNISLKSIPKECENCLYFPCSEKCSINIIKNVK